MSDEPRDERRDPDAEQPPDKAAGTPTSRPASASAAAARRARRIGGRPAGSGATPPADPEPPGKEPVSMRKSQRAGAAEDAQPDSDLSGPQQRTVVVTAVPPWLNWAPAAVLTAGALAMGVLLLVFSHGVWWGPDPKAVPSDRSPQIVREQVLAAAKTCLATTNTYDYNDMDGYEAKALACSTGGFTDQLRSTIDNVLKPNAPKLKATQTAQINRGGIEAVSPDGAQWTILLFGQLNVTNAQYPKGRTDPFAAEVIMEKARGKWLITKLNSVSSPLS